MDDGGVLPVTGTVVPLEQGDDARRRVHKAPPVVMADRGHIIWREKQKRITDGRARKLRRQIEGLRQELELLRHQLAAYR